MLNSIIYIIQKEKDNYELVLKLRYNSVIITPNKPFEKLDINKITNLISYNIFCFKRYNEKTYGSYCLFKAYVTKEVKSKIKKLYEKL